MLCCFKLTKFLSNLYPPQQVIYLQFIIEVAPVKHKSAVFRGFIEL